MTQRGMGAVKKLKKQMDDNRAAFAQGFTPNFSLKDGESALVRFNGAVEEEPLIIEEHSLRLGPKMFRSDVCAKGAKNHDGCVYCVMSKRGDKRISRSTNKACYNIFDSRWIHKKKDEEKSTQDRERFQFLPCLSEGCKNCKRNIPRVRAGQKKWNTSLTWAQALSALDDKLKRKCLNCGSKTQVKGYVDTRSGKTLAEPEEGREDEFETAYKCTGCKECRPRSIFDVWVEISRVGDGKQTTYQFSTPSDDDIDDLEKMERALSKAKPVDLELANKPRSGEKQAEFINVDNPFDGGGGKRRGNSESYDEDEEDEDADFFEDDEDE